jgi:hypothetical protein
LGTQEFTMGAALQFGQSNAMNYSTTFREVGRMVFWIWQLKCRPLFLWEEELHSNLLGALASSRLSPRRILGCNRYVYGKGQLFILMQGLLHLHLVLWVMFNEEYWRVFRRVGLHQRLWVSLGKSCFVAVQLE